MSSNTAAPDPSAASIGQAFTQLRGKIDGVLVIEVGKVIALARELDASAPAAAVGGDRAERMFAYVTDMATRHGWIEADGEGALEFLFRKHYAQGRDDTPAALRELADLSSYIESRGSVMVRVDKAGGCAPATDFEIELWHLLRTAASEGGEAVAWQFRFADEWSPCTLQEFNRFQQNSPLTAASETRALYTHPPEVARDAGLVAEITGVDEYGPMLSWHKHWVDVGIGTKLYAKEKP